MSKDARVLDDLPRLPVMVTLDREEMLNANRNDDLNDLVATARRTMFETMEVGPA